MSQINTKKMLSVNTKLINDLTKCVNLREASHTNFVYSNRNFSDQLRKRYHKFTHTSLLFLYHSIHSTLFFSNHLLQIS